MNFFKSLILWKKETHSKYMGAYLLFHNKGRSSPIYAKQIFTLLGHHKIMRPEAVGGRQCCTKACDRTPNSSAIFAFYNMIYDLNWQSNRKGRSLKCMTAHFYVPDMWLSSMVRTIMKI